MALSVVLQESGNPDTNGRDRVSLKAESITFPIRRSPIITPMPGGSILALDMGRIQQEFQLSVVLDEDITELFIKESSGAFTPGETILGTAGWDASTNPNRVNGAVLGCVAADGTALTDETTDANDVGVNDVPLLPAAPVAEDALYVGSLSPCYGYRFNIGTAGVEAPGSWTIAFEYSQGNSTWGTLTGVTDGTTEWTVVGLNNITFNIPGDWKLDTIYGITAYWARFRASAATNPIGVQPLATQIWTLSTPSAYLVSQETNRLLIHSLGHDDHDFFVDGETVTGQTSGITAVVSKPLATMHRWEQIAANWYSNGSQTLYTNNDSYSVQIINVQTEKEAAREFYTGKIGFVKVV